MNRHDGSRNGETMCRYPWMTAITVRAIRPGSAP
jgi:hypothetical protein